MSPGRVSRSSERDFLEEMPELADTNSENVNGEQSINNNVIQSEEKMENLSQEVRDERVRLEGFTSEFSHLYKNSNKGLQLSQQERRELILQEQKKQRHILVDKHRDFSELFLDDEDNENFCEPSEEPSEEMDIDPEKHHRNNDRFVLMQSEWFTDVPEDLQENWLVKLAPEGFRVLLIAKRQQTILLNDRGKVLTLKTHFPGGGLSKIHGLTVLDCIYNKFTKTVFVLDCLYWNTMSMLDSETTFRFYWLKNQFDENNRFAKTNKPHQLQLLEFLPAEKSLIQEKIHEKLTVSDQNVLYTGIVFYHKELQYAFKQTPLLGWLYSYMLPEKLGIDVPEELMSKMPKEYECLEKYLKNLQGRQANKQKNYYRDQRHEKQRMDIA